MATRRPAQPTTRSRLTSQSSRSRVNSVQHAAANQFEVEPTQQPQLESSTPFQPLSLASPVKRVGRPGDPIKEEMNVQVVVRCRIRSEKEVNENSPVIVTTQGAISEQVVIETAAAAPSFGMLDQADTKTYPYDRVFGPEADQAMLFNDVVQPILDEVVSGYNCTLFAYGQTGTGKTYTMQGDLTPSVTGGPCANAGMIPRALSKLYQYLESGSVSDYTVKISYVELYNEELRDLLAPDLAAPTGNVQPMGMAAKEGSGLKIFDEAGAGKKGVIIQGLEEIFAKDYNHAMELLRKGSHRRQIGATKFNEQSSRSHSIFTITVHTKQTDKGDDTLRVGKLNLVDLAGSENIGRSGAENKRAREAGMINQSLLTLGRVINALVDQSPHVPYRESKLTRLLQDSLGGRTKTCIVATISPARCNMEETLSTLDYALRAKSIRNKPEINQHMTRAGLLKDYVQQIERLKADLVSTRQQNGIYFSNESWNEISTEHEQLKTTSEERRKQIEIITSQMRAVRDEFEQGMALLMKSEMDLKETQEKLGRTEFELEKTSEELDGAQVALQEEIVVREAHRVTEERLNTVAGKLKTTAMQSVDDVGGLFGKLARKTSVLNSNIDAVQTHGHTIEEQAAQLEQRLSTFASQHRQKSSHLRDQTLQLKKAELETMSRQSAFVNLQLQNVAKLVADIRSKDNAESEVLESVTLQLKSATDETSRMFANWETELSKTCDRLVEDITTSCNSSVSSATDAFKDAIQLVQNAAEDSQTFVATEREAMRDVMEMSQEAATAEIRRLKNQNALLTQLLDSEKVKAEAMRDGVIQQISSIFVSFTDARDRSMRQAITAVRKDIEEGQDHMQRFIRQAEEADSTATGRYKEVDEQLDRLERDRVEVNDKGLKALSSVTTSVNDGLVQMQGAFAGAVSDHSAVFSRHRQSLATTYTAALENLDGSKRARIDLTDEVERQVRKGYGQLRDAIHSSGERVEKGVDQVVQETSRLSELANGLHTGGSSSITRILSATQLLMEDGSKVDVPTGTTPRKRQFEVISGWELTKPRNEVLRDWRGSVAVPDDVAPVKEPSPVPEEGGTSMDLDGQANEVKVCPSPPLSAGSSAIAPRPSVLHAEPPPRPQPTTNQLRRPRTTTLGLKLPGKVKEKVVKAPLAEQPPNLRPASRRNVAR